MRKVLGSREKLKSHKKKNTFKENMELFKKYADNIVFDKNFNLPFGFAFDDFIIQKRIKSGKKDNTRELEIMDKVYNKLRVKNEMELIALQKYAVAEGSKGKFIDKAKNSILAKFIDAIQKIRKEDPEAKNKILNTYFQDVKSNKEFYEASLKDLGIFFI